MGRRSVDRSCLARKIPGSGPYRKRLLGSRSLGALRVGRAGTALDLHVLLTAARLEGDTKQRLGAYLAHSKVDFFGKESRVQPRRD